MYSPVFARLRGLRDERQWGRLEWAQISLQLAARERADVTARGKLIIHNASIYMMKEFKGRVVGWRVSVLYLRDPKVEAIGKAVHEEGIPPLQAMMR
jgi:hypothetical protein